MLKISIAGKLGSDAVIKEGNGKKYLSFSVYSSYKLSDGNYHSDFVNCTYFTDKADTIAQFLKKGKGVYAEGMPSARAYMGKDGQPQASLDCIVRHIELCGDSLASQGGVPQNQSAPAAQQSAPVAQPTPEDLPF